MSKLSEYPIQQTTFITARETAKEESLSHPDHFIYLFKNNSGGYLIDHLGIVHSDERILLTFKKGEKVL
jgi:hypothetical protein